MNALANSHPGPSHTGNIRDSEACSAVEAEAVELLTDAITSNGDLLPPDIESAIGEVITLEDHELQKALTPLMRPKQSKRLADLNRKAQAKGLSGTEKIEQNELLHLYDKSMIVRAAVMAELNRRGFDVANLIGM